MRRLATAFAFLAATGVLLLSSSDVLAQHVAPRVPHLYLFETAEQDTAFWNANYVTSSNTDRHFFEFDQLSEDVYGFAPYEGSGAMVVAYSMYADQNFGGSMGIGHALPSNYLPDSLDRLYDLSDFTHFNVWYNVLQPANAEGMTLRIKLHDASLGIGTQGDTEVEDWTAEPAGSILGTSATSGWDMISVPLQDVGFGENPTSTGFTRPGCVAGSDPLDDSCWSGLTGNEQFDLDQISGVQFEFFGGTGLQSGTPDSTATGIIAFDKMHVSGVRYDLVNAFETTGDVGSWANGTGDFTLTAVNDTVQGSGALELDYHVVGSESWGGSVDIQGEPEGDTFPNFSERSGLSLFYKVVEPLAGNGNFTFKLFDNSTGTAKEEWHFTPDGVLTDTTGQWQRLVIPFDDFTLPSWVPQGDQTLNPEQIVEWQFQVIVGGGQEATGTIIFDRLTSYGLRPVEKDPPVAVENFSVTPSPLDDNANLVTWTDLADEDGETYAIYYSFDEITDLEADGVLLAGAGIPGGTEVFTHRVYHPVEDGEVSYFYAIRATDQIGQTSPISATSAAVTNDAQGIPTVSLDTPSSFSADGDLSEWQGIEPFSLGPEHDLGYVVPQTGDGEPLSIDDNDDLSADVYLAVDDEALYFAFDVNDNTYVPVPEDETENRWLYDGAELYIGLYNETRPRHQGARTSDPEPDYKFYIYPQVVRTDNRGDVMTAGESYYFQAKDDGSGYVIEARLPHDSYRHLTSSDPETYVEPFEPRNGMRVPLDIVLMDNDEAASVNRTGILAYSPNNNDNSYQSPRNWFYTWVGDQIMVSNQTGDGELPKSYALHQNYPNPFNPSTIIGFDLPTTGPVSVKVFNMLGQEVMTLVEGTQAAGKYEVRFDARDLASGVYFYQLRAGDHVQTQKMLLVR